VEISGCFLCMEYTMWRCVRCGSTTEYPLYDTSFSSCSNCGLIVIIPSHAIRFNASSTLQQQQQDTTDSRMNLPIHSPQRCTRCSLLNPPDNSCCTRCRTELIYQSPHTFSLSSSPRFIPNSDLIHTFKPSHQRDLESLIQLTIHAQSDWNSHTSGIALLLVRKLVLFVSNKPQRVYLSSLDSFEFYSQVPDSFSCGFRCFQMLCAGLLRLEQFRKVLFGGFGLIPPVKILQEWIELCWKHGFDSGGEYEDRALVGTKRWVGAVDICALLRYFGVNAQLINFNRILKQQTTRNIVEELFDYVEKYFYEPWIPLNERENARQTLGIPLDFKPPLYLQYYGHSCVVIGFLKDFQHDHKCRLVVLNPARSGQQLIDALNQTEIQRSNDKNNENYDKNIGKHDKSIGNYGKYIGSYGKYIGIVDEGVEEWVSLFLWTKERFEEHDQYQILRVDWNLMTTDERERSKQLSEITFV